MVPRPERGAQREHADLPHPEAAHRLTDPDFPHHRSGRPWRLFREVRGGVFHGVLRLVFRRLRGARRRPLLRAEQPAAAAADPDVFHGVPVPRGLRLRLHGEAQRPDVSRFPAAAGLCGMARNHHGSAAPRHGKGGRGHTRRRRDPRHQGDIKNRSARASHRGRRARFRRHP